jgi:RNA polymerase sigma-70 factor, ECF subfamily
MVSEPLPKTDMSSKPQQSLSDPERWVDDHGDLLYRYALVRVRDGSTAEELVQETFFAALKSRSRFSGASSERTWLVGILKHKIVDHFRRSTRELPADESFGAEDLDLFDANRYWIHEIGPADWGADPASLYERSRFWEVLEHCLGELPPRAASAFTLREIEGLEADEVRDALGVTPSNLWVILHRARAHLRLCLERRWVGASGGAE